MHRPSLRDFLAWLLVGGLALAPTACAYTNKKIDDDRDPVVMTGARATILYPNQRGPSLPSAPGARRAGMQPAAGAAPVAAAQPAPGAAAPGAPAQAQAAASPGMAPSDDDDITFIGGSQADINSHREIKQEPLPIKWLMTPVAIVAWPFKKAWDALRPEAPPPGAPNAAAAPPPPTPNEAQAVHERARLQALERELAERAAHTASPSSATPTYSGHVAPAPAPAPRPGAGLSIAQELAALRAGAAGAQPGALPAPPAPRSAPAPSPRGVADRVSDRDGDGRPDHWEYRDGGRLVRELFDENGDGSPDRTVRNDPVTGQPREVEEDTDFDARIDSFVEYRDGKIARRRADSDGDGVLDSWSFYREGLLARHEQDLDGDGFRDRIGFYREGRVQREEEDRNGDGRPDKITLYDDKERVRQIDEDRDGDGLVDQRSHYEAGRLVRRELIAEDLAAPIETQHLRSASWESGDPEDTDAAGQP